jgi:hypothetical protein
MLKEMKATMLLRDPSTIAEAIDIYQTLPKAYTEECFVYGSPFVFSAKTPNFSHHDEIESTLPKMTRFAFAEKINLLQSKPLTASNAYLLGLAYFNASYYGLQWKLLAYYRFYNNPQGNVSMEVAEDYLRQALSLGGLTEEQEVEVYFMLARCEQNRYTLKNGSFPEKDYYAITFSEYFTKMRTDGYLSNFQQLSAHHRSTKTYQTIIKECKYFYNYVN